MTRRQVAFLLIALGVGPVLIFVAATWFVWFHHMFIIGIQWRPASIVLALPFLSVLIGVALLYRGRSQRNSS
jgi:hypothetical protein